MFRTADTLLSESQLSPTLLWDLLTPIAAQTPTTATRESSCAAHLEPRVDSEEIIAQARAEAEAIRSEAIADAEALMQDTERSAELLKADARKQGMIDGTVAAYTEVEGTLRAEWDQRVSALQADVQRVIDAFAAEREAIWLQTETDMIAFILEIARKVVKVEVSQNPAVVSEMIRHALRRVVDKENVRVRVNPDELELARTNRKDLALVLDGARSLEIIDDRRIGRGGCVIETGAGTIDARIETQFREIARALESTLAPAEEDDDEE